MEMCFVTPFHPWSDFSCNDVAATLRHPEAAWRAVTALSTQMETAISHEAIQLISSKLPFFLYFVF